MAAVSVTSVIPESTCVPFGTPFSFAIEYECLYALKEDLEWKMIYVGSAEFDIHDQVLDSVLVGPVLAGNYKFIFEGNAPDPSKIPTEDIIGVTVVLLTCSYKGKEFIRIGYYVNVDYADEQLRLDPPETLLLTSLFRTVLSDHPRVTRFPVDFDNETTLVPGAAEVEAGSDGGDQPAAMEEDAPPHGGMLQQQGGMVY